MTNNNTIFYSIFIISLMTFPLSFVEAVTPPTECASEPELTEYNALISEMSTCNTRIDSNPQNIDFANSKACLQDIGAAFKAISSQDCKDTFLLAGTDNLPDMYQKILDSYLNNLLISGSPEEFHWDNSVIDGNGDRDPAPSDSDFIPYVQHYFSLVGEWYSQAREEVYPTGAGVIMHQDQADFLEDKIIKKFWDRMQATSPDWLDTFGLIPALALAQKQQGFVQTEKEFDIFVTVLNVQRRVLEEVLASEMAADVIQWVDGDTAPGPSPVLAIIFGDLMAPVIERVNTVTQIMDIACKLNSCNRDFYDDNETFWMLNFFDKLEQGTVVEKFNFESHEQTVLITFLKALYGNNDTIKRTIAKMNATFGVASLVAIPTGSDFPNFFESFLRIFSRSHDLMASYESTQSVSVDGTEKSGFFHGSNIAQVNVGFGEENMGQNLSTISTVNEKLKVLTDNFIGQHTAEINKVLDLNSQAILLQQLDNQITIDTTNRTSLDDQQKAVSSFIELQKIRLNDVAAQIQANLDSNGPETFTKLDGNVTFDVDASSAAAGGDLFSQVGKVLLQTQESLQVGDLLEISVSGEYQPNCSIQAEYGDSVKGSRTGPRGFVLTRSKEGTDLTSTNLFTTASPRRESHTMTKCSLSTPEGYSIRKCDNTFNGSSTGEVKTTSHLDSNAWHSNASFDLGMTLKTTPYPTAPVGALLLVEMANGEQDKDVVGSLQVLSGSNNIVVRRGAAESTYYLVVNDCSNSLNQGSLNVTVNQYRPEGDLVAEFVTKVKATQDKIDERVKTLIEEGVLSQSVINDLRLEIDASGTTPLENFTGNIGVFLRAWIESKLSILGYQSQVSNMNRELQTLTAQLDSLMDRFEDETALQDLRVSQRNWNLANLDFDFVNTPDPSGTLFTLNRVLRILNQNLVSYLDFRFNEDQKRTIIGDISLLSELDFSAPFDEISRNMTTFMDVLLANLEDDLNNRPVTPKLRMGIHVPNPYYELPTGFPSPTYDFPVLDSFRAQSFWDKIYAWKRGKEGAEINFDVLFKDLYAAKGLACYVEAPIINSFVAYFIPENEAFIADFNSLYLDRNAKLLLNELSHVPFENNPRSYNFINKDWRFMDIAVRMAKSSRAALRNMAREFPSRSNVESGLGTGRSPFGFFQIGDIPAYNYDAGTNTVTLGDTPLNEIKELFIAYTFAASSNDFNVNLGWMDFCKPGGAFWQAPFRNMTIR